MASGVFVLFGHECGSDSEEFMRGGMARPDGG